MKVSKGSTVCLFLATLRTFSSVTVVTATKWNVRGLKTVDEDRKGDGKSKGNKDSDDSDEQVGTPYDIAYPTTCSNLQNSFDEAGCRNDNKDPLKMAVLKTASCTSFAEPEVPLRLGLAPSKCFVVPVGQSCYDPTKYSFGLKSSQCKDGTTKTPQDYASNAGTAYPPRRSLSDETLEQFCRASACVDGLDGPLIPPAVFEHLVETSSQCLLTPVLLFTLTQLGAEWDTIATQLNRRHQS